MTRHTFNYDGNTYIRVSRRQAKRQYMQGKTIVMTPCNLIPFSPWAYEFYLRKVDRKEYCSTDSEYSEDFDSYVNSFEYYNCNHNETGRYASFYVKGA